MKKILVTFVAVFAIVQFSYSQSTFPTDGSNVGIGTATPIDKLEVVGGVHTSGTAAASHASEAYFDYYNGGSRIGVLGPNTTTNGTLSLQTYRSDASNPLTPLFINSTGNVGIGTTSPGYQLDLRDGTGLSVQASNANIRLSDVTSGINLRMDNSSNLQITNNGLSPLVTFLQGGNVGIGITNPDEKLAVNGTIHTKEVKVDLTGWSDYVFKPNYKLPSLTEVKNYIDKNRHLPDMPSEQTVINNGINLGEMNKLLTRKVEELTLYSIDQNNRITEQNKQIAEQNKKLTNEQQQLDKLKEEMLNLKKEFSQKN